MYAVSKTDLLRKLSIVARSNSSRDASNVTIGNTVGFDNRHPNAPGIGLQEIRLEAETLLN